MEASGKIRQPLNYESKKRGAFVFLNRICDSQHSKQMSILSIINGMPL